MAFCISARRLSITRNSSTQGDSTSGPPHRALTERISSNPDALVSVSFPGRSPVLWRGRRDHLRSITMKSTHHTTPQEFFAGKSGWGDSINVGGGWAAWHRDADGVVTLVQRGVKDEAIAEAKALLVEYSSAQ